MESMEGVMGNGAVKEVLRKGQREEGQNEGAKLGPGHQQKNIGWGVQEWGAEEDIRA